MIEKSPTKLI